MRWWPWSRARSDIPPLPDPADPHWERALINRLAYEYTKEQASKRRMRVWIRWGIVVWFGLMVLSGMVYSWRQQFDPAKQKPHIAVLKIEGTIAPDGGINADRLLGHLRAAFTNPQVKGVILRLNSPGGSPVQASYIHDEIIRLKDEARAQGRTIPVYAVAMDLCTSAAYYIAVAADEIFVNPATLIGSIGVRLDGFGFQELIHRLGIERRLLIAGQDKAMLDPFVPMTETHRQYLQGVIDEIHARFIAAVKAGRGERLKAGIDAELFSGRFWSGETAVALGLADHFGTVGSVARERLSDLPRVTYTKVGFLERLSQQMQLALQSLTPGGRYGAMAIVW